MEHEQWDHIVTGMSDADRASGERLLAICNRHEGLDLPMVFASRAASGNAVTHFLSYHHGDLVGLAWLPDDPEPEACLIVHPAHRRRGIGRVLVAAARSEARRRGLPGIMLVCDEAAGSGTAFATAVGGRYRAAEYRLKIDPRAIDRSRPRQGVALRPADVGDVATLTGLLAASFGTPAEVAREQVWRGLAESKRRYFLAAVDGNPVGLLQAGEWEEGSAGISAFGVLPAYRGRRIGRQMLLDAVDVLLEEGWEHVLIEVVTDNERALSLYRSCGFRVTTAYGFYDLTA
jgi:ribosomal protein S18 acetylase RimI-like enzyme